MLIFKNPEMKAFVICYLFFTGIAAICAGIFLHRAAVFYTLIVCILAFVLFYINSKRRYRDIANVSFEIDKILHASEKTYFVSNKEGELAILTNQISKMTIRLQEQAEQLEKEKNNLSSSIADISHQIRTPLTSIRMLMHRLMKEDLTQEQKNQYICETNSMLSRIEWLTTALLKIARLESGAVELEQEKVNVEQLVESALKPLEIAMELKGIQVNNKIPSDISFNGDLAWTGEAISNILKNCMEHTPDNGQLTIQAMGNSLYTKLLIADTGSGIDEEDLAHLFERFYKGKNSSASNIGIGLSLSRMIIKRENGTIKARNLLPHGMEFEITFYKGTY